jgi:hypothetical protein
MEKRSTRDRGVSKGLTESKTEKHWIDAMPICIDYRARRAYVKAVAEGKDVRFVPCFSPATTKRLTRLHKLRFGASEEEVAAALREHESESIHDYEGESHDAYEICKDFLAVNTSKGVVPFLKKAGEFWPLYSMRWSEFQRWQEFVRLISQWDFPVFSTDDPDARAAAHHAWNALHGLPNTFFPAHDERPATPSETASIARMIELDPSAAETFANVEEAAKEREAKALRELPECFRRPPASALSIDYGLTDRTEFLFAHDHLAQLERQAATVATNAQRAIDPEKKKILSTQLASIHGFIEKAQIAKEDAAKALKTKEQQAVIRRYGGGLGQLQSEDFMPVLHIRARNVLEAIAATVCAKRWHGVRQRLCKHCGQLFKVESEHKQIYCDKTCKNAATTKATRTRKANEKKKALEAKRGDGLGVRESPGAGAPRLVAAASGSLPHVLKSSAAGELVSLTPESQSRP